MNNERKDAIHRVFDIARSITICIALAYTGLSAQTEEYLDLVILDDGTILNGVHTLVTKDWVIITTSDRKELTYAKKYVSEVMKKAFDPSKGYKDLVILKDGTVWHETQTLVVKDSLIVVWANTALKVYKKSDVSEVKKGVFDKAKGFRDTVTLKDGTVIEHTQTLVTRDSLIVVTSDETATIYLKKEVSDVTKVKEGIELILIPSGDFTMGCSPGDTECSESEKPAHKVKITKSFYMGKYEVTQGQWKAVMGSNPSNFKDCGDKCPVESVSWDDIQEFLVKLNAQERRTGARMFRLPTEAEWEYAARGGTTSKYYANDLDSIAWYDVNSGSKTHPVGQKTPNAFGLYDMLGNVWEWCADWYGDDYYSESETADPTGPSSGNRRVLRGGSWYNSAANGRSFYRDSHDPGFAYYAFGFRIVTHFK